jgi:spore maturation protein CgeB
MHLLAPLSQVNLVKICRLSHVSQEYSQQIGCRLARTAWSYSDMKAAFDSDCYSGASSFCDEVSRRGARADDLVVNVEPLQRAWARENMPSKHPSLQDIAVHQLRLAKPDVLWYDSKDPVLLARIRQELPGIAFVVGWEGSAVSMGRTWKHLDLVLSCAPETVEYLTQRGIRSEHFNWAFDTRVTQYLVDGPKTTSLSFLGGLIRRARFHEYRDALLDELASSVPLELFASRPDTSLSEYLKIAAGGTAMLILKAVTLLERRGRRLSWSQTDRLSRIAARPRARINPRLARCTQPPRFGMAYYQTIRDSLVSLNVHADSSPRYASNMRLFEIAGVGTCQLTDYRDNLRSLFDPDTEIVTYRSAAECAERAKWLVNHPAACASIASRGRARVLREHTVAHRAGEFLERLNQWMRKR